MSEARGLNDTRDGIHQDRLLHTDGWFTNGFRSISQGAGDTLEGGVEAVRRVKEGGAEMIRRRKEEQIKKIHEAQTYEKQKADRQMARMLEDQAMEREHHMQKIQRQLDRITDVNDKVTKSREERQAARDAKRGKQQEANTERDHKTNTAREEKATAEKAAREKAAAEKKTKEEKAAAEKAEKAARAAEKAAAKAGHAPPVVAPPIIVNLVYGLPAPAAQQAGPGAPFHAGGPRPPAARYAPPAVPPVSRINLGGKTRTPAAYAYDFTSVKAQALSRALIEGIKELVKKTQEVRTALSAANRIHLLPFMNAVEVVVKQFTVVGDLIKKSNVIAVAPGLVLLCKKINDATEQFKTYKARPECLSTPLTMQMMPLLETCFNHVKAYISDLTGTPSSAASTGTPTPPRQSSAASTGTPTPPRPSSAPQTGTPTEAPPAEPPWANVKNEIRTLCQAGQTLQSSIDKENQKIPNPNFDHTIFIQSVANVSTQVNEASKDQKMLNLQLLTDRLSFADLKFKEYMQMPGARKTQLTETVIPNSLAAAQTLLRSYIAYKQQNQNTRAPLGAGMGMPSGARTLLNMRAVLDAW